MTEREIFIAALEKENPAELAAFLDEACAGDTPLRQRVESLLREHQQLGSFMDVAPLAATVGQPLTDFVGTQIGPYKLLEQIGEGGMGVVYMAEQQEPVRRKVALKLIKPGMDTRQVIARFEAERQALAVMDHPSIARVLDAGATEQGRPYFVMELVRGVPITTYSDEHHLSVRERLELFASVCQAIQHAHTKGIIHRDIKPTNVLVTRQDGQPVVKVIDFGVAKALGQQLTDKTLFTNFTQMVGTPLYMSPEQAEQSGVDIDTRSDIYSLGVLLYELLTGSTPVDQEQMRRAAFDEIRRIIRTEEPLTPSARISGSHTLPAIAAQRRIEPARLSRLVRGELDWIVMKSLEKDRNRRYETANSIALDIQRYLSDEPVQACPPSTVYRLRKLVRRNKLACIAVSAVTAALLLGLGLSTWLFLGEKDARNRAVDAEQEQSRLRKKAQLAQASESKLRLLAEENQKTAQAEATKSKQVAEFLLEMFNAPAPWAARGQDTAMVRQIMDRAADRIGVGLADQPDVEAELRSVLGQTYWSIVEYEKAEAMHRRALELYRQSLGNMHPRVAKSLRELALTLRDRGRRAEAEALLREALAIQRQLLGNDSVEVAHSLRDLGLVLSQQNKQSEAEVAEREALAIRRKVHGRDHVDVADSLNRLACVLTADRNAEGAALASEAVAMLRRLNSNDIGLAKSLQTLATVLQHEGKLPEAEIAARESVDVMRKAAGDGSWTVDPLFRLMVILNHQGKNDELSKVFEEIPIPSTGRPGYRAGLLEARAQLLGDQGKLAEAEGLYRKAIAIRTSISGSKHPQTIEAQNRLMDVLRKQGKSGEIDSIHNLDDEGSHHPQTPKEAPDP